MPRGHQGEQLPQPLQDHEERQPVAAAAAFGDARSVRALVAAVVAMGCQSAVQSLHSQCDPPRLMWQFASTTRSARRRCRRGARGQVSASDDAWRCQAPASCQSLDQQACATARSRSSRCMALSYLLLLVPKCVPWPTPVHTHRAAVGAARALLQVFRSLAAVCSPSIVAFDFGFSDRSFSATLCEKDNPERKPPSFSISADASDQPIDVGRIFQ